MGVVKLLLAFSIFGVALKETSSHGMLWDPINRSSAWKKHFRTPRNDNDNQLYCGGMTALHGARNKGKCGVCGDEFSKYQQPRPNENGGKFGTGVIVKSYQSGETINVTVRVTANHRGRFFFSVCPLSRAGEVETEECFQRFPVALEDGSASYSLKPSLRGDVQIKVTLPRGLACEHCVFRWHWVVGNNWGRCTDGAFRLGCGNQEEFRTCSDVRIL